MKISVCIATYNGEQFVSDQINSILKQIGKDDEIIISDDESTDKTLDIIKNLNDGRIKIFINKGEHGYTPNFENALSKAEGDIIFLSDQDDVWLPSKYETVIKELKNYDLVVTNSIVTDESLNVLDNSFFNIYKSGTGIMKNLAYNTYFGSCMAFRKRILDEALPFPKNREVGFDIWIGMIAEIVGKVKFIQEPQLLYRRHGDTVTSIGKSDRPLHMKLYKRSVIFMNVSLFYIKYKLSKKAKL